jgi:hypothetical protein
MAQLDAFDERGELALDRRSRGRLAGAAGTRDQEQHDEDYRNGLAPLWWTRVDFAVLYNRHGADDARQRLLFFAGSVPVGVAAVAIEAAASFRRTPTSGC